MPDFAGRLPIYGADNPLSRKPAHAPETGTDEWLRSIRRLPPELAVSLARKSRYELGRQQAIAGVRLDRLNAFKAAMDRAQALAFSAPPDSLHAEHRAPALCYNAMLASLNEFADLSSGNADVIFNAIPFSFVSADFGDNGFQQLAKFGRDLDDSLLLRIPYPECWFEMFCQAERDTPIRVGIYCAMNGDDLCGHSYIFDPHHAIWTPFVSTDSAGKGWALFLADAIYACVALLSSKFATTTTTEIQSACNSATPKDRSPKICHVVTIAQPHRRSGRGTGTHKSPIMHWRRGHLRHYKSGFIAQIAPMLVNGADGSPIEKEYRVRLSAKNVEPTDIQQ